MEIIEKKLNEIKPYENNPRKNDKAVEAVANSIAEFGFKIPIVIDKDGVIVAGHTRYKAAKKAWAKNNPLCYLLLGCRHSGLTRILFLPWAVRLYLSSSSTSKTRRMCKVG